MATQRPAEPQTVKGKQGAPDIPATPSWLFLFYKWVTTSLAGLFPSGTGRIFYSDGVGGISSEAAFTYDATNNVLDVDHIDVNGGDIEFTAGSAPSTPASGSAVLYAGTNQGHTQLNLLDEGGTLLRLTRDSVMIVRNTSGTQMVKGDVVTVYESTGTVPEVKLADADTFGLHAEGIIAETIANNGYGLMITVGRVSGLNTNGLTEGGIIYLSGTAGTYSQSLPTGAQTAQALGYVILAHATQGIIEVRIDTPINPEVVLDAMGVALTDSTTVDFTYDDGAGTITAATIQQMSVTADASGLKLVNDQASPGNSKMYGTDSGGTKGWQTAPSGMLGDGASMAFAARHG